MDVSSRIKTVVELISVSVTPDLMKTRITLQDKTELLLSTEVERLVFKNGENHSK